MSYQVLARKWRPRSFKELVGQTHVLQALVNALDQDRLHHAYLFTGTRGVGKTTIARILAKCLNCEQGVSSTPCGECAACHEINDGRFVDLIEVDAASRTKVEDTRELLDNVQYAPTRGRFKVYLIDEVHMLSAHSFNALLKTLEEPPPHVKFLLATTDPQKLPVTILSRCLQFGLKNMTPERIVGHLENVLGQETIGFESQALWQLARAADGSMRDALSLTDQAIAFGNGRVNELEVSVMLGTIDQGQVMKMITALAAGQATDVLAAVAELAEHAPDYAAVLDDMLAMLHRIAIAQAVPDAVDNSQGDREQVLQLASGMMAEDVQLYYQVGLVGKRDLPLAPDPRGGFEMALLRMLAFRPEPVLIQGAVRREQSEPAAIAADPVPSSDSEPEPAIGQITREVSVAQTHLSSQEPSQEGPQQQPVSSFQSAVSAQKSEQETVEPVGMVSSSTVAEQPVTYGETHNQSAASAVTPRHENPLPEDFSPSPAPIATTEPAPEAVGSIENQPVVVESQANIHELPPVDAYQDSYADASEPEQPEQAQPLTSTYETYAARAQQENSNRVFADAPSVEVVEEPEPVIESEKVSLADLDSTSWIPVFRSLPLAGVTRTIASHCEYLSHSSGRISLRLDGQRSTLYNDTHRERAEKALSDYFQQPLRLSVEVGVVAGETPAAWRERKIGERLQQARYSIFNDSHVQSLVERFSGVVLEDSIRPIGNVIK
ncbi:DNA polymerase III subunit gamma/tau [Endozoicomonas sp. OPT23]|uniref:DNA polymerase III subunit gamma/tau n=1 Tax=Endozoicomonas sp. OPT23 TaxID=2072845 RepID=UPI00129B17B2|nr:DNA polymerase III subunit gamma/tau [Endozoicomonas sp. OPT23]MRI34830.1 DNA polymerase III subunit gamma/tau [Endozoicomonas sp. OPT23]